MTETQKQGKLSRRNQRRLGRMKRAQKLGSDGEFAKVYFEEKSKRSAARKVAYKKRHVKQ